MRLISRKIWRAFPELDAFDDETCQRYINRAWHLLESFRGWVLAAVVVVLSLIGWYAIDHGGWWIMRRYLPVWIVQPGYPLADLLRVVSLAGYFLAPWLGYLWLRDIWLSRQVRRLLAGARCPHCKYSLLGLVVYQNGEHRCVRCPECAFELTLSEHGVTEADINLHHCNGS